MTLSMSRVERIERTYPISVIPVDPEDVADPLTEIQVALLPANVRPDGDTIWVTVTVADGEAAILWTGADAPVHVDSFIVPVGEWDPYFKDVDASEILAVKGERISVS